MAHHPESLPLFPLFSSCVFLGATLIYILRVLKPSLIQPVARVYKHNLDQIELLSPTHGQRSQQQSGKISLQSILINTPKFLKAKHCKDIRKIEIPCSVVVETLSR